MNGRSVVSQGVCDVDNDIITPVGDDGRARDSAVDSEDDSVDTIWCGSDVLNIEPIFSGHARVWNIVVVVSGNVEVSPASPVGSAVVTSSLGQRVVQVCKRVTWGGQNSWKGGQSPKKGNHDDVSECVLFSKECEVLTDEQTRDDRSGNE